jgi:hypothetical protein
LAAPEKITMTLIYGKKETPAFLRGLLVIRLSPT